MSELMPSVSEPNFLQAVARHVLEQDTHLADTLVVFPNKRSMIFFRNYMHRLGRAGMVMPEFTTIGAFNDAVVDDRTTASRVELLFVLYRAYAKVLAEMDFNVLPFDDFAYWGSLMLNDFDNISSSLADGAALYENLKRYYSIASRYLDEEQKAALSEIVGKRYADQLPDAGQSERMWVELDTEAEKDLDGMPKKMPLRTLKLWKIMGPVYEEFHRMLASAEEPLSYPGLTDRLVYERLADAGADSLPAKRIIFVGFSRLSQARHKVFTHLHRLGVASFYWDLLDPDRLPDITAGDTVANLAAEFPMPEGFDAPIRPAEQLKLRIIAVPSRFLMGKVVGVTLKHWIDSRIITPADKADTTAIMLPDSSLLSAVLHGLPEDLPDTFRLNLTMGMDFRGTPFASLLSNIVSMFLRRSIRHDTLTFFNEDISALVLNPQLRALMPDGTDALRKMLDKKRVYNVPYPMIEEALKGNADGPDMMRFFRKMPLDAPVSDVREYLLGVIGALQNALKRFADSADNPKVVAENSNEWQVLEAYRENCGIIFDCIDKYSIGRIAEGRILVMVERLMELSTVNMSGSPLRGIQVMGPLETRVLDFDNIIIPSMNERVMPRRRYTRTLIPQILRTGYKLASPEEEEQDYAYNFFRLFNRAKNVTCLYDSRSRDHSAGVMSRYLTQLMYLNPDLDISQYGMTLNAATSPERVITVKKTDEIMHIINGLSDIEKGYNLSASALKKYLKCPLSFYLNCIRGFRDDEETVDYMDAPTFGSIVHKVLQNIYTGLRRDPAVTEPVQVDAERLKAIAADGDALLGMVEREINRLYHKSAYSDNELGRMPGESLLLAEMMRDYIREVLKKDVSDIIESHKEFAFFDAEHSLVSGRPSNPYDGPERGNIPLWASAQPGSPVPAHRVRIRMDIDRLDSMGDTALWADREKSGLERTRRFIDYKTGSDKGEFSGIDPLFDNAENDAVFQLLFYSMVYSDLTGFKGHIIPELYRIRKAFGQTERERPFADSSIYNTQQPDKAPFVWTNEPGNEDENRFRLRMAQIIHDIFDPEKDFTQTDKIENCRYCSFKTICRRTVPDRNY